MTEQRYTGRVTSIRRTVFYARRDGDDILVRFVRRSQKKMRRGARVTFGISKMTASVAYGYRARVEREPAKPTSLLRHIVENERKLFRRFW